MALVPDTWTGNQDDGDPLSGTNNMAYLTALRTGVNDIDNSQINANAGIAGTKLADLGVTNSKIANTTIQDGKLLWNDATNGIKAVACTKPQRKEIWGKKAFTIAIGTDEVSVAIVFATDGADTPVAFANATDLIVCITIESTIVDGEELTCDINTIAATGFNAVVRTCSSANVAANRTGNVHFHAIGRIA